MPRVRGRSRQVSRKRGGGVNKPLEYFGIPTGRYFHSEFVGGPILKRWVRSGGKKSYKKRKQVSRKKKSRKKKRGNCMCKGH